MKLSTEKRILILVTLVCGLFASMCIKAGHNWGGDFALYIAQAKSITNLSVHHLFDLNKYSMDHSIRDIGPYLYPWGFPVLLSPVYYVFGINFVVMKWFCSLFFFASFFLIFKLFRSQFSSSSYVFFIIIMLAFNVEFLSFCDNILSDFPFLFFSLLSILLIQRSETNNTIRSQLIVGACIYFSYFTRDIGIVLVPVLMLFQLRLFIRERASLRNKIYFLIPHLVFAAGFLLVPMVLPKGGQNHYSMLAEHLSPEQIRANVFYYSELLSVFFSGKFSFLVLSPFIALIILGMFVSRKETLHLSAYIVLSLIVLLIWPAFQGLRFLFPILPFLLFFLLKGFVFFCERVISLRPAYIVVPLFIFAYCSTSRNIKLAIAFGRQETNQCYTPETVRIYSYISRHIPQSEIVGFVKPAVLRLFTGVNSIYIDEARFAASPAKYFLTEKSIYSDTTNIYPVVYESENYILIEKE